MMPLVPTGYGDSPYASLSAFAGNPLLISLEILVGEGLLDPACLPQHARFPDDTVNLCRRRGSKGTGAARGVRAVHERRANDPRRDEFTAFPRPRNRWLHDFALFIAIKHEHGGRSWLGLGRGHLATANRRADRGQ